MRLITKISVTALALVASVSFVSARSASALTGTENKTDDTHLSAEAERIKENAKAKVSEQREATKEAVQTKLQDAKLRVCQKREQTINSIMDRIGSRGQKQLDVFTTISERTQKFYTDKHRTLDTYNSLVAEVDAKHAAAQSAIDAVKSTKATFACDGSDPKGAASAFKDSQKAQTEALKAYRTSVKNLIVGVKSSKSAQGDQ